MCLQDQTHTINQQCECVYECYIYIVLNYMLKAIVILALFLSKFLVLSEILHRPPNLRFRIHKQHETIPSDNGLHYYYLIKW